MAALLLAFWRKSDKRTQKAPEHTLRGRFVCLKLPFKQTALRNYSYSLASLVR